jgi:hypothetical protein
MFSARFLLQLEDIAVRRFVPLVCHRLYPRLVHDGRLQDARRRRLGPHGFAEFQRRMIARASDPGRGPWLDSVTGDDRRAVLVLTEVAGGRLRMLVDPLRTGVTRNRVPGRTGPERGCPQSAKDAVLDEASLPPALRRLVSNA